jgi:hypothetical protein
LKDVAPGKDNLRLHNLHMTPSAAVPELNNGRPAVVRPGPGELGEDPVEFGGGNAAAGVGHGEDRGSAGSAMPVSAQQ